MAKREMNLGGIAFFIYNVIVCKGGLTGFQKRTIQIMLCIKILFNRLHTHLSLFYGG